MFTLEQMEAGLAKIKDLQGKERVVLVIGPTGVGKSTLIANMMGATLISMEDEATGDLQVDYKEKNSAFPQIGHEQNSCTTWPAGYQVNYEGKSYTLADTAGFFDNRPGDLATMVYIFLHIAIQRAQSIHGIFFVMDEETLKSSRGEKLAEAANIFNQMFSDNQPFKNLCFVVTKTCKTEKQISAYIKNKLSATNRIIAEAKDQNIQNLGHYQDIAGVLSTLLEYSTIITANDIESFAFRDKAFKVLRSFEPIDKSKLKFSLGSDVKRDYENAIHDTTYEFIDYLGKIDDVKERLDDLNTVIESLRKACGEKEEILNNARAADSRQFSNKDFLEASEKKLQESEKKIVIVERDIADIAARIHDLNNANLKDQTNKDREELDRLSYDEYVVHGVVKKGISKTHTFIYNINPKFGPYISCIREMQNGQIEWKEYGGWREVIDYVGPTETYGAAEFIYSVPHFIHPNTVAQINMRNIEIARGENKLRSLNSALEKVNSEIAEYGAINRNILREGGINQQQVIALTEGILAKLQQELDEEVAALMRNENQLLESCNFLQKNVKNYTIAYQLLKLAPLNFDFSLFFEKLELYCNDNGIELRDSIEENVQPEWEQYSLEMLPPQYAKAEFAPRNLEFQCIGYGYGSPRMFREESKEYDVPFSAEESKEYDAPFSAQ